ncbi:hypothetical protein NUW54_g10165 [Trametes sanguinea]|uniref:Uncharacterized protein n=1 Tax=Trametes sanguinea TaxID=158606 RepID=A0ACC1P1K1_9APHY|nr:hypothetical protein NUW54_g10165 [Trametes sanguinea]
MGERISRRAPAPIQVERSTDDHNSNDSVVELKPTDFGAEVGCTSSPSGTIVPVSLSMPTPTATVYSSLGVGRRMGDEGQKALPM